MIFLLEWEHIKDVVFSLTIGQLYVVRGVPDNLNPLPPPRILIIFFLFSPSYSAVVLPPPSPYYSFNIFIDFLRILQRRSAVVTASL
jgi:hypothetical protein